ncbi:hypothetical protein LINPERHAP1_LOCUS32084 [Linum perenne]
MFLFISKGGASSREDFPDATVWRAEGFRFCVAGMDRTTFSSKLVISISESLLYNGRLATSDVVSIVLESALFMQFCSTLGFCTAMCRRRYIT